MRTKATKMIAAKHIIKCPNAPSNISNYKPFRDISHDMPFTTETIRDPNEPTRLRLLCWKSGKHLIRPYPRERCKPSAHLETELAARGDLRLPERIMPCGDLQELITALKTTICNFVELPEDYIFLVSLYILSTWFADCMKSVPYLWLVGPLGSGKSTLLKFLHCVCRRAMLIGDVRPASLYKLSILSPTLLIDELEPDGSRTGLEVRRFLRIGNTPGVPAARNGQLFETFSSKVFSSRQPPLDMALASRAIVIRMLPTQTERSALDRSAMEEIANEFQPRLLMYRIMNYMSVQKAKVPFEKVSALTPRIRELIQAMAASLLGQATFEDRLIAILREHDLDARTERSLEPEWLVVEALFISWHRDRKSADSCIHVLVGGLSSQINESLEFRGEGLTLPARKVGGCLKSLGVRTRRLGNLGRGITFTSAMGRKIHELAQRLGFDRSDIATLDGLEYGYGGAPCTFCEEIGLTAGLRFVDLRTKQCTKLRRDQQNQLLRHTPAADTEHKSTFDAGFKTAIRQSWTYSEKRYT